VTVIHHGTPGVRMTSRNRFELEAYAQGLCPYWLIHPDDRPADSIVANPLGEESQAWLRRNAPALTQESCHHHPPRRPTRTLVIPGDGLETL
jgi:hypothetical protein